MDASTLPTHRRRRLVPLAIGGAVAALILTLGINGTLAAWTTAIITNTTNTAAVVNAVALSESTGAGTCVNTATSSTNTAQCTSVNKYGGTETPLTPGQSVTTSVTLTNTGTGPGALTLDAGACTVTGGVGGADAGNLCSVLTVAVACPAGTSKVAETTLTNFDTAAPATIISLDPAASITCQFTIAVPDTAPSNVAGQTVSQPLIWTLTGA